VKKQLISDAKAKPGWAAGLPRALSDLIAGWFSLWGLAGFERHITLEFSTRLQRTLGRCYTQRRRIHVAVRQVLRIVAWSKIRAIVGGPGPSLSADLRAGP